MLSAPQFSHRPPAVTAAAVVHVIASPIGPLRLASDGAALVEIRMEGAWTLREAGEAKAAAERAPGDPLLAEAARQLRAYFDGRLRDFELPLAPQGTEFQQRVWTALRAIPYGTTASYGELARRIGEPGAARAVGLANGANPIPVVVPCHRVIGANGAMTGFGGGIDRKRWLLAHEARCACAQRDLFELAQG